MYEVDLLRVSAAWDEETVNWDTQPWAVSTGRTLLRYELTRPNLEDVFVRLVG